MAELRTKLVRGLCGKLQPWIAELVIREIIPERLGRYRILDWLLWYSEGQDK